MKRSAASAVKSSVTKITLIWTSGWAAIIYLVGYLATALFPFVPTYPYYNSLLAPLGPAWLVRWGGFDGVHYLTITEKGYFGTGLIQAFFPVYPFVVRIMDVVRNPLVTGMFVSFVCVLLSDVVLVKLVTIGEDDELRKSRLRIGVSAALLSFPTAFFFLGVYTESLFLLLVLLSFFLMHKKKWALAAVIAGIASGTRVVGVALFPALLIQAYFDNKTVRAHAIPWRNWLIALASLGGLAFYMLYLQRVFHDPLYFFHVQAAFGGGRQDALVLFPQVMFRYVKILMTVNPFSWAYYSYAQELLLTAEVGVVLLVATLRRLLPWSYLAYAWLGYLIPPLTGTFQSMPRYVLVLFPVYLVYARWFVKRPRPMSVLFLVHAILLVVNIVLFFEGRWVA